MSSLRIRMYDVGFGDCFLLTLPGKRTVLVDCGFHSQGKGSFSGAEIAKQVIADATAVSGKPRIDVVIATHRHQDHVFCFNSDVWEGLDVGEVWLPWVEDRKNTDAQKLWKKHQSFAAALAAALPAFNLDVPAREEVEFMLWNAGVDALGAWSNAGALDQLHDGFAHRDRAHPRFLPEGLGFPETFESPALPGVTVHVLGPARKPELLQELDPKKDGETYRALWLAAQGPAGSAPTPFGKQWVAPDPPAQSPELSEDEVARLGDLARNADPLLAAHMLDDMINSTSLVLVLQVGQARLLLPGDAEWGTWKVILGDAKARALLATTTFLKVGHHGSHNATPKTLVEKVLRKGVKAMIPTQEGPGNYRNDIPLDDLLTALTKRGARLVRSDKATAKLPAGFKRPPHGRWTDLALDC